MNRLCRFACLPTALLVSSCVVSERPLFADGTKISSPHTELHLRDTSDAGVIAEIMIQNASQEAICVPSRYLGLSPWPFEVTDANGKVVRARHDDEDHGSGRYSEAFYLIGSGKKLIRSLPLGGSIDLPQGASFAFKWTGVAYPCDQIASIVGTVDALSKVPFVAIEARASLPK